MDEVVIRTSQTGASITFSARRDLYFPARVDSPDVSFGKTIYGHTDHVALIELFERMAVSWKGWQDSWDWASLESDMSLRCAHDGLGHVDLELSLINRGGQAEW